MKQWLTTVQEELDNCLAQNIPVSHSLVQDWARLQEPYWYLGGPMTDEPDLNIPRFASVGTTLRERGYNMVLPTELDAACGADASDNEKEYLDFLARDFCIISTPQCIGGIFLERWWASNGARRETYILEALGKQLFEYADGPILTQMKRSSRVTRSA